MSAGRRVYIAESLQRKDVQRRIEKEFGIGEGAVQALFDPFVMVPRFELSSGLRVDEATPKSGRSTPRPSVPPDSETPS